MKNNIRNILIGTIFICTLPEIAYAEKHKEFGDYTTYISTHDNGVVYKQANVKLNGMLAELSFYARSNSDQVFAFVNKQPVQLIIDGSIMDNELNKDELIMVKNANNMAVIHGNKTYMISTKGSGASMIYITDFPQLIETKSQKVVNDSSEQMSMSSQNNKLDNLSSESKLIYLSGFDAYNKFNNEWKVVCKAERLQYEKWRVANIVPMLDKFKIVSKNMDFSTNEWRSLNEKNQDRIKNAVNLSQEWKEQLACEETHLNANGYTQRSNKDS